MRPKMRPATAVHSSSFHGAASGMCCLRVDTRHACARKGYETANRTPINRVGTRQILNDPPERSSHPAGGVMDFISILSIFVLACFVGYYVVWSVTPALHTPLMSVTNAISSVIVVGALIASAAAGSPTSKWLGLTAVALASVNIFGGFAVTARMLAMYKKRERKDG